MPHIMVSSLTLKSPSLYVFDYDTLVHALLTSIPYILPYVNEVAHLGHVLSYNLDDTPDIIRAVRDMNRKVYSILFTFSAPDPFVKSFLVKTYCLSLYGCSLWTLNSPSLKVMNKLLRKVWNLPYKLSHGYCAFC